MSASFPDVVYSKGHRTAGYVAFKSMAVVVVLAGVVAAPDLIYYLYKKRTIMLNH